MLEFTVNVYNLVIIASVFIGLTFGLLLIFTKRINQDANIFLGLLSLIIVLWNIWVLSVDFNAYERYPWFCIVPLNFSLALGPMIFFYTKKIVDTGFKFTKRSLVHFIPIIFELLSHVLIAQESLATDQLPYETQAFAILIPIVQLIAITSIVIYSLFSLKEIRKHHLWISANYSNDEKYQLRWLYRLIIIFGLLWLLLVPYTAIDYFFYDFQLSIADYYPIYILMSIITIWISAEAFLKPEIIFVEPNDEEFSVAKKDEGNYTQEVNWLVTEMERNQYFLDPELTLRKLAEDLDLHPNHLSKIINSGLNKNFSDFVNEYRVKAFKRKVNDPTYAHITLLGISFECGFNSKTTFNRVFKNLTGKTPFQFKKEGSIM